MVLMVLMLVLGREKSPSPTSLTAITLNLENGDNMDPGTCYFLKILEKINYVPRTYMDPSYYSESWTMKIGN